MDKLIETAPEQVQDGDAEARHDDRYRPGPLPFQFQIPLGGGAPGLAVPIGGYGSPLAFTVPLGGAPAPAVAVPVVPAVVAAPGVAVVAPPQPPLADPPLVVAADTPLYVAPTEDEAVQLGEQAMSASALLQQLLMSGRRDDVGQAPSASGLFNAILYPTRRASPSALRMADRLDVVARPGEPLGDLSPRRGDVLIRVAPGQGWGLVAVIGAGGLRRHDQLAELGLRFEGYPRLEPGGYVHVVEPGPRPRSLDDRFARRLCDATGQVLPDTLLLRLGSPHPAEAETDPALAPGQRGPSVRQAQAQLNRVDADLKSLGLPGLAGCPLPEDGRFGAAMTLAVQAFQRQVFDDPSRWDGALGPATQAQLELLGGPRRAVSDAAESVSSEKVRWLQDALNRAIGAGLTVDGIPGRRTTTAVRRFQQGNGLTADGIAGPRTLAALRSVIEDGPGPSPPPPQDVGVPETQVLDRFEFGRAELLPIHQPQIINLAYGVLESQRSATPITTLTAIGHTDPVGSDADNEALGLRRAEAVRDGILAAVEQISHKPAHLKISVESRGEREQMPGDAAHNRRVEVRAPFAFKPRPPIPVPPPPAPTPTPAGSLDPPRWRPILSARLSPHVSLRAGNGVRHLIDGGNSSLRPALSTYRSMAGAIRSTSGREHYIYLLGWAMVDDFELVTGDASSTARALLAAASAKGVQIRAMLWRHPPLPGLDPLFLPTEAAAKHINALPTGAAIIDNATPSPSGPPFGSHHQKALVIRGPDGLIGFVGGVDINSDRILPLPPPAGPAPSPGSGGGASGPSSGSGGQPLHDIHCRIVGPSAFDVLLTFIRRWDHHPGHVAIDSGRGALVGRGEPVPAPLTRPTPDQSSTGSTCSVVIARTFNPVTPGTAVPKERDIRTLLLESIKNARRFIYMEDQYLINLEAARALRAALPNIRHLTILITASEIISDTPCIWSFRREFFDTLTVGLPAAERAKVRMFRLASPPIPSPPPVCGVPSSFTPTFGRHTYVHAKSWVFDDELAVIGSANCNRRGWDHDSEVNAFIFDDSAPRTATTLTLAQSLRMDLWREHLNVPASAVTDGLASARLWLAPPAGATVLPYCPNDGHDTFPVPESLCGPTVRDNVVDPFIP